MLKSRLTFYMTCAAIVAGFFVTSVSAQPPQGFGPPGGGPPGGGGPGNREDIELLKKFDADENGWLNRSERAAARKEATSQAGERRGGPQGRRRGADRTPPKSGPKVSPDKVKRFPDADLYAPDVVRTLFFEFENEDWEKELEDFRYSDVEVPATLTVDGKTYRNVGISFRGASSYFSIPTGFKRSFNVSMNLASKDQRLYGYKTLNLLNSKYMPQA